MERLYHDGTSPWVFEPMPSYVELFSRGYAVMLQAYKDCGSCGWELSRKALLDNASLTWTEVGLFFACAVMWTLSRRVLTTCIFQPLACWCDLKPRCAAKMPESSWKLCFYSMSWSYSIYLLFCSRYSFFQNPPSVFYGWKRGIVVPMDIAVAYLIQGSFYGHSIYATIYMDAWRRDSIVMVIHHVVTLALITFSYAFRYHNVGVLVLFLHDVNDVLLEFTKLNVYFKSRGDRIHLSNSIASTLGCVGFSVTWFQCSGLRFWFRLYWFPLKVLYATCVSSLTLVPDIPFYFFFNGLLLLLLLMNIYWFLYIVLFVVKVLTGQIAEVNDLREYEDEEGLEDGVLLTEREPDIKDGSPVLNGLVKDKHL
ncbi:hypothetical protein GJAV_G00121050 [Gymnothorax javanicus]|nr:hypothetical protein GJAV_G00121050 [Gymnothorax javanicus]